MSDPKEGAPIACALDAREYRSRLAWIAALNVDALLSQRLDGRRWRLTYALRARDRVRQMVRQEQECCAFLSFEVREDAEAIEVTIEAPEGLRDVVEAVFDPFRPGAAKRETCGCRTA